MRTPDPLPEPGAWLVMPDGSMYEVMGGDDDPHADDPTPEGVHYLSVDSGEVIYTPWTDVHAVGTYESVDAIAAALAAAPPRRTDRFVLTITHDEATPPPDAFRGAVAGLVYAVLDVAGIPVRVTIEPADPEPTGPHGWTCPADDAEHWPRSMPDPLAPGDTVECGHCGYAQTWTGIAWTDPRS
jgi:hypothetical protein